MSYKNVFILFLTLSLIFITTLVKNKSKDLEDKIYNIQESISKNKSEYEILLLEYSYLASPNKLMEYYRLYFDEELVPFKINELEKIVLDNNSIEIKEFNKFSKNEK